MKNFIFGLIVGALSIGGFSFWIKDEKPISVPICDQQEKIIEKIVTQDKVCPEVDFKQHEDKITKAFLYFLATIGIRENYQKEVRSIVSNPEMPIEVENNNSEEFVAHSPQVFLNQSKAYETLFKNDYYTEIRDNIDSPKKHEAQILTDPVVFFARSKSIEEMHTLRRLNGQFKGKLYRLGGDHHGQAEDVEIAIDYYEKKKGKPDGKFLMTLSRNGTEYSRMRGEGSNNDILLNPEKPEQIIIRAAPGMYFHFLDRNLRQANVYDEGKFVGISSLQKM